MKLGFFRNAFLESLVVEGAGSRVPRRRSALDPGSVSGELSWLSLGVFKEARLQSLSSLAFRPGSGKENLKVRGMMMVDSDAELLTGVRVQWCMQDDGGGPDMRLYMAGVIRRYTFWRTHEGIWVGQEALDMEILFFLSSGVIKQDVQVPQRLSITSRS